MKGAQQQHNEAQKKMSSLSEQVCVCSISEQVCVWLDADDALPFPKGWAP